jgi:hypothetical protein
MIILKLITNKDQQNTPKNMTKTKATLLTNADIHCKTLDATIQTLARLESLEGPASSSLMFG